MPEKRPCDGCTVCCTVLNVPEVDAPPYINCAHQTRTGCGIHAERPPVCRNYFCEWAVGNAPEWMKPNLSGIIPGHTKDGQSMHLYEVWTEASLQPRVIQFIRRANARKINVVVTLHPGPAGKGKPPEQQRSRMHLFNGEVREFEGLNFKGYIGGVATEG